nr:hypothetical protein [Pseudomonas sp. phDV1]
MARSVVVAPPSISRPKAARKKIGAALTFQRTDECDGEYRQRREQVEHNGHARDLRQYQGIDHGCDQVKSNHRQQQTIRPGLRVPGLQHLAHEQHQRAQGEGGTVDDVILKPIGHLRRAQRLQRQALARILELTDQDRQRWSCTSWAISSLRSSAHVSGRQTTDSTIQMMSRRM